MGYLSYILSLFSGGYLIPSMGLHEGDPAISPCFLICAECLPSMLEEQSKKWRQVRSIISFSEDDSLVD
jgi:hypothetical protein